MAWIETVGPDKAAGSLRRQYEQAIRRAGKVFHILRVQSPNPEALEAGMDMYLALMKGPSPLSRAEREMIAVVVSAANRCHY